MELRSPPASERVRTFAVVDCAQCGEPIFAPEWSECQDDRRVRHLWVCEACDYHFETIVRFPAR